MSNTIGLGKKWEGKVVDGKFPLRQWLGGSDQSAVFLTDSGESRKRAIKLVPVDSAENDQLSRWNKATKLAHPHLIRLFACGRCQIDGTQLVFVVMEFAEENLSEIIPLRPLSPAETTEMLPPLVEALSFLHKAGYVHGHVRPSNIMAVDNQLKISADGLRLIGERRKRTASSVYDAPETATLGSSPASDIWSLGATLTAVVTQKEPKLKASAEETIAVPEIVPEPLRKILRECLRPDPQQRGTLKDILQQLRTQAPEVASFGEPHTRQTRATRWMAAVVIVAALFFIGLIGSKFIGRGRTAPAAETQSAPPPASANNQPAQSESPLSPPPILEKAIQAPKENTHGSVLQRVMPEVSQNALNTITGHVKVSVRVDVDASGNVTDAHVVSAGPSKYFAGRALNAARGWKFNPPQMQGKPATSAWLLRFQFSESSAEVFPAEVHP